MAKQLVFTRVTFRSFKALRHYSIGLRRTNILVGPNNAGKSTILDAFRVLAAGLRRARAKSATPVNGPTGPTYGYTVPLESIPTSLENVHTDYADADTSVEFRLSNGTDLVLFFPKAGGCHLVTIPPATRILRPGDFRTRYPVDIGVVPVLGPVDHDEALLERETVQRALSTRRASLHFRNFWYHFREKFDVFGALVRDTWPGLEIERPELDAAQGKLVMFCREKRLSRELFWAGFGFQVWCQILTHVVRSLDATLLIIDEPEIYLHPDVQRQLLSILEEAGPDVLMATHSTELLGAAEPQDIVVVDKDQSEGNRLKSVDEVQGAIELLGSNHNLTLSHLARTQRVVFVEGDDAKLLYGFARRLKLVGLASGVGLTVIPLGGFQLEKLKAVAWGIESVLKQKLSLAVVLDRDYRCPEELASVMADLRASYRPAHIHVRKELENYLLIPGAIDRALRRLTQERCRRTNERPPELVPADRMLLEITESLRDTVISQYIAKRAVYLKRARTDDAELTAQTLRACDQKWGTLASRLEIVPGKEVFAALAARVATSYSVTLTQRKVVDAMEPNELPSDLASLLAELESFRTGLVTTSPAA
jgi:hypothetical protein